MCYKMNSFFVLALVFFETVAPIPSRFFKNENLQHFQNAEYISKYENDNQQSNLNLMDSYIPRSLPAYMSPIPTQRDSRLISESEVNTRLPRQVFTPLFEPSIRFTSILNERGTVHQAVNEGQKTSQFQQVEKAFARPISVDRGQGINYNVLPNSFSSFNRVPETIQDDPILKTVQEPFLTATPVREIYHPVVNVRREQSQIPLIDAASIASSIPINIEQRKSTEVERNNHDRHIYRPVLNKQPGVAYQNYNVDQWIANQRIKDVLSSTKHKKRYLVIHPNGRIEHVDHLESITKNHPNYVLVNAGHVVANDKAGEVKPGNIESPQILTPASTSKPNLFSEKILVSPEPPLPPTENTPEQQSSLEIKETSTETATKTDNDSEQIISTSLSPVPITTSKEILETTSAPPPVPPTQNTSEPQSSLEIIEASTETVIKTDNDSDSVISISSSPLPITTSKEILETTSAPSPVDILETKDTTVSSQSEIVPNSDACEETSESPVVDAPTAITDSSDIEAIEVENASEIVEPELVASVAQKASSILVQNIAEKNEEQILEEPEKVETIHEEESDTMSNTDVGAENALRKPTAWFNTSDPGFWNKLTDGKEDNIIYFFQVKFRPRVEKDIQRTVYPDGTIVEELTESVWYDENDEAPIVTKTTRVIHPDDV